jgi:hypothetical protein
MLLERDVALRALAQALAQARAGDVSAALSKLDLGSRREAVATARELGVTPAEGGGRAAPR